MTISAVVITHNEEENIVRCLKSLAFCDEIIVVDSSSSDRTCELARQFTDQVQIRAWAGFVDQKNFACMQAKSRWILSVDADEEVSPELRAEISRVCATESGFAAYSVPRKTFHFNRWIRHGGWYPNRLVRLFLNGSGAWVGDEVHEYWESSGRIGRLESDLVHYSFVSLSDQVDRNNRYSTLGAKKLARCGTRFSLFRLGIKPLSKFIETYFLKLGFLDGYPGLIISISAAYSVFLKWAKLWELGSGGK